MKDDLVALSLDLGLLLDDDVSEQLLLQTLKRYGEVDQGHLNAHFRRVERIGHLSGHIQLELVVVVVNGVTKPDLLETTLASVLRVHEQWVNRGVNGLLDVLDKHGVSVVDGCDHSSEQLVAKLKDFEVLILVHVPQPHVCLLLRVNAQAPSLRLGCQDTVFDRGLVSG